MRTQVNKVLLVEDDEQGVIPAELFFDPEFWEPEDETPPELLVASNTTEFEQILREQGDELDLIVTDIALSDDWQSPNTETGVDTYGRLRELAPDVPCVAITGQAPGEEPIKAIQAGICDWIKKPFSWREVWPRMVDKVSISRLRRAKSAFQAALAEITGHLRDLESLGGQGLTESLLRKIMEVAVLSTGADGGWIFLVNSEGKLESRWSVGLPAPTQLEKGIFMDVYTTLLESCLYFSGEEDTSSLAPFEADKSALLAVPLVSEDRCLGVLEVVRRAGGQPFEPTQVSLLSQFGSLAANTVEAHSKDVQASAILLRALRHGVTDQGDVPLSELDGAFESLKQEATQLDPTEDDQTRRLLKSLTRLKSAGPHHLEYFVSNLNGYIQMLEHEGVL